MSTTFKGIVAAISCAIALVGGTATATSIPADASKATLSGEGANSNGLARVDAISASFIENAGQTDARVAFVARSPRATFFVTNDGVMVYALAPAIGLKNTDSVGAIDLSPRKGTWQLVERFIDRSVSPVRGATPMTGSSRTYLRDGGVIDAKLYETIDLGYVYPGIDVQLRSRAGLVEKFFIVNPGADPGQIQVAIEGSLATNIAEDGRLQLLTGFGDVSITAPKAWQEIEGVPVDVQVAYSSRANQYGFQLGSYDKSKPVYIDPLLQSTYIGASPGAAGDYAASIVVHPINGDIYVAGQTASDGFPGTAGGYQSGRGGSNDAFIARLTPDLTVLVQATYLGGTADDYSAPFGRGPLLAIDPTSGDVLVAGTTSSTNFPGTSGGVQPTLAGSGDFFVARLDATLTTLVNATYGGVSQGHLGALAINPGSGDVYVGGYLVSPSLPSSLGGAQSTLAGGVDAFLMRFNGTLSARLQSTYFGGSGDEYFNSLVIEPDSGDVYLAGYTTSVDLPGTAGSIQPTYAGGQDGFVARFNSSLTSLLRATYIGGSGQDQANALAIALGSTDVIVAGFSKSADLPGMTGGAQSSAAGDYDGFLVRLNATLTTLVQGTYLGGSGFDYPTAIAISQVTGDVFVTGQTNSSDFPSTAGGSQPTVAGGYDAFVARLNSSLTTFRQGTYLGGGVNDIPSSIAVYPNTDDVYLAGYTASSDFPGIQGGALTGDSSPFIARFSSDLAAAGPPAHIVISGGTPQSTTVGQAFAAALRATVRDANNYPVSGAMVTFSLPPSGASGSFVFPGAVIYSSATTNSSGVAISPPVTANTVSGSYFGTASIVGVAATPAFYLTNLAGPPSSIAVTGGANQSAALGFSFAVLQATVRDAYNNPVSGSIVTFTLPSTGSSGLFGGNATIASVSTDPAGVATSPTFTATGGAGSWTASASAAGVATPATFSLTNTAAAASSIVVVSGTPQLRSVGGAPYQPLVVKVTDSASNPVAGVTVNYAAPATGASVTLSSTTAVTGSDGQAQVNAQSNTVAGSFSVSASVNGVPSPALFSLQNAATAPVRLAVLSGAGQSAAVLTPFTRPIQLVPTDRYGNGVPGVKVTFVQCCTAAGGTFPGGQATYSVNSDASGIATAATLTANSVPGNWFLYVEMLNQSNPSAQVALTNSAGPPAKVQIVSGTPQTTVVGFNFATSLVVKVADAIGTPVSGATVTFAVPTSGASSDLSGYVVMTDRNGVASVDATANGIAGAYTITASVGGTALQASFGMLNAFQLPGSFDLGDFHACVLAGNGVQCWGDNSQGQLGIGSTGGIQTGPVDVVGLNGADAVSTGGRHSCALSGGGVKCWGDNSFGQLGRGSIGPGSPNAGDVANVSGAVAIASGEIHTCVLLTGGTIKCWGNNLYGQLGSGATGQDQSNAVDVVDPSGNVIAISAGGYNTCALLDGGVTKCWGINGSGELGTGSIGQNSGAAVVASILPLTTVSVDIGDSVICALTGTGGAKCWGGNGAGQLGNGGFVSPQPGGVDVQGLSSGLEEVRTAGNHSCALTSGGGVKCWGANDQGQLGTGSTSAPSAVPLDVYGIPSGVVALKLGFAYACAQMASGAYQCWGDNSLGQLGNGSTTGSAVPVFVSGLGGAPASISVASGSLQNAPVTTAFAQPLLAVVKDSNNAPVPSAIVTFSLNATGGAGGGFPGPTPTRATVVTDATGTASAPVVTANTKAGTWTATATVSGVGSGATFSLTNVAGTPAAIAVSGGNSQTTLTSTLFPSIMQATVTDAYANLVSGASVTFTLPATGASGTFPGGLKSVAATTDASGTANAPPATANATAGTFAATAQVSGVASPANFTLTNVVRTGTTIVSTSGTPQTATVGSAYGLPLRAVVKDGSNNPIPNLTVTFTLPASAASGTFPGGIRTVTAVTDAAGNVVSPVITATTTSGTFIAKASVAGVGMTANFSLTNAAGAASAITARVGAQAAAVYATFGRALSARVTDSSGNVIAGANVTFTLPSGAATATFQGGGNTSTIATDATGTAVSPLVTANSTVGTFTTTATVTGVAAPASFAMTNTVGTGALFSILAGTPQTVTVLATFGQAMKVQVSDASSRPIQGVNITFTLPGSTVSATFAPPNVRTIAVATNSNGQAASPLLTATNKSGSYVGTAKAAGIAGTLSFNLSNTPSTPTTAVTNGVGAQSATVNTAFAKAPSVKVTDANANRVPGVSVTFTAPASGASGAFAGNGTSVTLSTDSTGIATSPFVTANSTVGAWVTNANVGGIATPVTFAMTNVLGAGATIAAAAGSGQSTAVGTAFAQPLKAIVKDGVGNPVAGVTVTFTLPTGAASARFMPANSRTMTAVTDASGTASTSTTVIQATATAGNFTATATATGATGPAGFSLSNL